MFNPFRKTAKIEKKAAAAGEKNAEKSPPRKAPPLPEAKTVPVSKGSHPLGVIVAPRITEKSTALSQTANKYVFEVSDKANAQLIKRAVEGKYGVRVAGVNVLKSPGKRVRLGRQEGRRKGFKKAIVTVAKGQSIEFT